MVRNKAPTFIPLRRRLLQFAALSTFAMGALHAPSRAQDSGSEPAGPAERIIVSGASGQLGGLVVEELLARGVPAERLILVSRTPEGLQPYAEMGAAVRYGDFTEPLSLPAAYAGGDRMLLISIGRTNLPRPQAQGNAIRAAVEAGVRHIAYTSWVGISHGETEGLSADHAATETILRDSGAAWTMLRNSIYADGVVQDAAAMIAAGRVVVPENADRITYVTREDCAAAAAAVLIAPGHENRAYDITGPAAVGPREIAAAASAVTGAAIDVVAAPASSDAQPFGGPALAAVSSHVEELTGRPATSVRALLEAHREELMAAARR
jgi:NAD(P)H dehydrogenase (quinone)